MQLHRGTLGGLIIVASALVACGGAENASPGAVPMTESAQAKAHRASSHSGDLLYVPAGRGDIFYLAYPGGAPVGELTRLNGGLRGICSDQSGNVFIMAGNEILEYAHGGTLPINTLSSGGYGCSRDPTTGNLAVADGSRVLIFTDAKGTPKTFTDSNSNLEPEYCAYDRSGNLFVNALNSLGGTQPAVLLELPAGGSSLETISLNQNLSYFGDLGWDGKYLAIDEFYGSDTRIARVKVSGSSGTVIGTTILRGASIFRTSTWLQNGTFASPVWLGKDHASKTVFVWSYPSGGNPSKRLSEKDFHTRGPVWSVAVSVAPSGTRVATRPQNRLPSGK
jgi:hypothetical protein